MIELQGVTYATVHCATGVRGFAGEGYPFHKLWKWGGMNWRNTGFSGKTLTLNPRKGNISLKEDGVTPIELFPQCISANFLVHDGSVLNAIRHSNFGAPFYLKTGIYHKKIKDPFFISIFLESRDFEGRMLEMQDFCQLLKRYLPFSAPVALQWNVVCPNPGHNLNLFHQGLSYGVEIAKSILGIPVFLNCNALMPTSVLREVSRIADGLWIGNTIPWEAPETTGMIDWGSLGFVSPLRRRGVDDDGGLSSHQCLPFTIEKICELRDSGVSIPIIGGNSIRTTDDVHMLKLAGADGIFIGSLAMVRPWRMKAIIDYAHNIFN